MARVTVEDCVSKVRDRFELVALSALRAKNIASGMPLTIERKGEKNTVLALREIAKGTVEIDQLKVGLVESFQKERQYEEINLNADNARDDEIEPEEYRFDKSESKAFSFAEENIETED